jgi:hypothetical protein
MYPKYVEVDGKRYKINTDFRVAIKCDEVARDESIGDFERALSIIYLLFGEEGIDNQEHYGKLLELAKKYLLCGKEEEIKKSEERDMDLIEDYSYIKTSFRSDYGIKLDEENMHWWEFMDLMNGLSNSEFGSCCVLNRVRNLRNFDLNTIKDSKERQKIKEAKESVALKGNQKKPTKKQQESIDRLMKDLGIVKEE